jgi:hypothetical protein
VFLAILEKAKVIGPLYDEHNNPFAPGSVAAGYQNFFICIEMFFAAVALKYAFPVNVSVIIVLNFLAQIFIVYMYVYIKGVFW